MSSYSTHMWRRWLTLEPFNLILSPPLKRWGHVGLPLSAQFVSVRSLRLYVPFINVLLSRAFYCAGSTVYDAEPTLAQYWVTEPCLAAYWMCASITDGGPTLTQLWFKASCRYRQHADTTSMKYWLGLNGYWPCSTGDAGLTFNRHWIGAGLYSPPAVCSARPAAQQTRGVEPVQVWCWASVADGGPELEQHWVNVSCLLGVLTGHIMFRTSPAVKIIKLLPNWLSTKSCLL